MDNIRFQIQEEKIIIKKGFIDMKTAFKYIFCLSTISIFFIICSLKNEEQSLKNTYIIALVNNFYVLWFMKINWIIFVFFLFLNSTSFSRNMYLEEIIIDEKIKIKSISYVLEFNYEFLTKIEASPFYEANYNFIDGGTFYSHFYDKCTITFITKDEKKYKWGFSLSYQKGLEIKNLIEERIKKEKVDKELDEKIQKSTEIYNLSLNERYQEILKKIIEEEKLYISKIDERTIINGNSKAIQNLEVFKNMKWEEVNFYTFYVNYLSKKEEANEYVEVAYNGTDSKKVKVSELKEDINKIRYPQDYEN